MIISKRTSIPVTKLVEKEIQKLSHLEEHLGEKVIGQPEAIQAVANAIRRSRAGLKDPNRPIGSFLFLGPTGVGKTELAKQLAALLFDDQKAMIRIDMSEYMEKQSVARLIGSPPGYIGYEEGGQLTETVRKKPYAVILFDEVEKAHPEVFNTLLQLLDDGRLTDSKGRTVDFKNTIIILTSNLGENYADYFRPEFINRLDEIIRFNPLSQAMMEQILHLQIQLISQRLLREKQILLDCSAEAKQFLIQKGRDPAFGARPLKRALQKYLLDPLALGIIEAKITAGNKVEMKREKNKESLDLHIQPLA